jgi:hypothetical protein
MLVPASEMKKKGEQVATGNIGVKPAGDAI